MSDRVTTYNPMLVTCALGNHIVSGYADDSFISVEPNGDGTSSKVGCDGEIIRSIDPNNTGKVTLSLQQNSRTNKFLIEKYYQDRQSGNGTFSITIKDLSGSTKVTCDVAWVAKLAKQGYGKQANNREWEIQTGSIHIDQE